MAENIEALILGQRAGLADGENQWGEPIDQVVPGLLIAAAAPFDHVLPTRVKSGQIFTTFYRFSY